jgi:hypothetical protein
VLASGCGGSSYIAGESAPQIAQAMTAALDGVTSTTINGSETKNGSVITIAATIFSNGDIAGAIDENGNAAQLIKIGGNDYLDAGASYFTSTGSPARLASALSGKWIEVPDGQSNAGSLFSFSALIGGLAGIGTGTVTKGKTSTIDGVAAVSIVSPTLGTIWVPASGTPYPIEVVVPGGSGLNSITFSNWNEGTIPKAPIGSRPASTFSASGASGTSGVSGASGASGTSGTARRSTTSTSPATSST